MFCDHYLFVSPSLTSAQINTCTSYYQNGFHQPWYLKLVTLLPILIGAIVMFRNIKRTIYDALSAPVFIAVVALFIFQVKKYDNLLATEIKASDSTKEGYLRQIAYTHAIIVILLVLLLILQGLAASKVKVPTKKIL
jgi:hypothetical protein